MPEIPYWYVLVKVLGKTKKTWHIESVNAAELFMVHPMPMDVLKLMWFLCLRNGNRWGVLKVFDINSIWTKEDSKLYNRSHHGDYREEQTDKVHSVSGRW